MLWCFLNSESRVVDIFNLLFSALLLHTIVTRPGRHRAIVCAGVTLHGALEEILLRVLLLPGGQGLGGW